jgi:hypothetical protein
MLAREKSKVFVSEEAKAVRRPGIGQFQQYLKLQLG